MEAGKVRFCMLHVESAAIIILFNVAAAADLARGGGFSSAEHWFVIPAQIFIRYQKHLHC